MHGAAKEGGHMKSRRTWIVVALALGMLVFSLGALSALAVTHSRAAPNCGTPTVDTIPCIESGYHDGVVPLNGQTMIGGLRFRPGNWYFIAKVVVASAIGTPHTVTCTLTAGSNIDTSKAVLPPNQGNTATMTVVQSFATTAPVTVSCDGVTGTSASLLKITGIRAGTLFNQVIP
jgi:hypothetical protein